MKLDFAILNALEQHGEEGREFAKKLESIPDFAANLGPVTKGFLEKLEAIHDLLCAGEMPGKPQLVSLLDTVHILIRENFEFRTIIDNLKLSAIRDSLCRQKDLATGEHNFAGRRGVPTCAPIEPLVKAVNELHVSRDARLALDLTNKTPDERGREWTENQRKLNESQKVLVNSLLEGSR